MANVQGFDRHPAKVGRSICIHLAVLILIQQKLPVDQSYFLDMTGLLREFSTTRAHSF